jgi:hypothetical protein
MDVKKLAIAILLVPSSALSPTWAQTPTPIKPVVVVDRRADNCKPIGRTEDGRLVYSMKCENMPAPTPPPAAAAAPVETPAPVVEEDKGGLFGMHAPSFIRPTNNDRPAGVGPATQGR